jgi:hypothetical protein
MEPAHTLQRSDQKRLNKVRSLSGILEAGESPLTEAKEDIITERARELYIVEEAKLQEGLQSTAMEGGNNPVLMIRAINLCIQQLKREVDKHRKAKEAEAKLKKAWAHQLEYLTAVARSLEEALKRSSIVGVAEAHREPSICLKKFKASLFESTAGKAAAFSLRVNWVNKAERICAEMYWTEQCRNPGQASRRASWSH